jgi:uncharacterized protein
VLDVREDGAGITFDVKVVPRSSRDRVGPVVGDRLKVAVTAPPVDGEANAAVVAVLSRVLGVPRASVRILRGETGRQKTIRVDGASRRALLNLL